MRLVIYGAGQQSVIDLPVIVGAGLPQGQPGQVIGYDAAGNPVAMAMPPASLPQGQPGQLVGYDPDGLAQAVDAPQPQLSTRHW